MKAKEMATNEGLQLAPWVEENNKKFRAERAQERLMVQRRLWKRRVASYLMAGGWCALTILMFACVTKGGF